MVKLKTKPSPEAQRFKIFRKQVLKMPQWQLGEEVGKDQSSIMHYEKGDYPIPSEVVKILNVKFNMSFEYFYHGKGEKTTLKDDKNSTLIKDIRNLANKNEELEQRIKKIEAINNKLIKDFYAHLKINIDI